MGECIPVCPQGLVGQLAALPDANLQNNVGKMLEGVIPQPTSKEGSSPMQMPHEVLHAQAASQRTQPENSAMTGFELTNTTCST